MGSSRTSCLLGETFPEGVLEPFLTTRSTRASSSSVPGVRWRWSPQGRIADRSGVTPTWRHPWAIRRDRSRCGWEAVVSDKTSRIGRLGWIQIDTSDPERLAAFWKLVLGVDIEGSLGSP